jgi:hypothetical protein
MKFICDICNYSTNTHCNYKKHILTKKHSKKVNTCTEICRKCIGNVLEKCDSNKHFCEACLKTFNNAGNLSKHRKICSANTIWIEKLKDKNLEIKKIKKENQNKIDLLEREIETLKNVIDCTGGIVKTSMSAINYAIKNYNNAPEIKMITNGDVINENDNDEKFGSDIIYYFRHKTLAQFVGDYIIKIYKKDDAKTQSIWSTDTSRLTYIIRKAIKNNPQWMVDKKGTNITIYIIDPIIEYMLECIEKYYKKLVIDNDIEHEYKVKYLCSCMDAKSYMKDKVIHTDIHKYITPKLCLHKDSKIIS